MGLKKNRYEQNSVGYFCGKHAIANRYGTQKNENERISVGHFSGKHAMEQKKRKCFFFVCLFFFCGHLRK